MTTSYTSPGASTKDLVRFYVGDCGKDSTWELTDEEITAALVIWTDALTCAAECCDSIAGRYASKVSVSLGNFSISDGSARYEHYKERASLLRKAKSRRLAETATIVVGGITVSGRETAAADSDLLPPAFTVEQNDFLGTASTDTEEEYS